MTATAGKRTGARRAPKKRARPSRATLQHSFAVGATLVAWVYLVFAAIDFGVAARDGDSSGWIFLALASLGAIACLFAALILCVRMLRLAGIIGAPPPRRSKA